MYESFEYCQSYRENCLIVEEKALQFLANIDLPAVNVPTLRDLSCTRDFVSLLDRGKRIVNLQEYSLFLVSVTEVVSCACQTPTFFSLTEKKKDICHGFPRLLSDLNYRWERLLGMLSPKYITVDQLVSLINLFTNAVDRFDTFYKPYFYGALKKSQECLSIAQNGKFCTLGQVESDIEKRGSEYSDEATKIVMPKNVSDITKYLSPLPKPCLLVQQNTPVAIADPKVPIMKASDQMWDMATKENKESQPKKEELKPRLTLIPISRLTGRENIPEPAVVNTSPQHTKLLDSAKKHKSTTISAESTPAKQICTLATLANNPAINLCSPVKSATTETYLVITNGKKTNAFEMMMQKSRETAKRKAMLAKELKNVK